MVICVCCNVTYIIYLQNSKGPETSTSDLEGHAMDFQEGKQKVLLFLSQTVRIQEEVSSSGSFLGSEAPQGDPEKQQQ